MQKLFYFFKYVQQKAYKINLIDIEYRNMTKTVESVAVTPMQIILKISSKRENVSYASISNTGHDDGTSEDILLDEFTVNLK